MQSVSHAPAPSYADRNVNASKPKSREQDIEPNKDEIRLGKSWSSVWTLVRGIVFCIHSASKQGSKLLGLIMSALEMILELAH